MSNRINFEIRRIVASRANFVCEYCLIAEADAYFKFQVEHIISRKHGGSSELENLAWRVFSVTATKEATLLL